MSEKKKESPPPPPLQFGIKTNVGIQFREASKTLKAKSTLPDNGTALEPSHEDVDVLYNQDGRLVAVATATTVKVLQTDNQEVVTTLTTPGVTKLFFSPQSTFLVT